MLEVTNIVTVSLSEAPAGLNAFEPNNVVIFSKEVPSPLFSYKVYLSPKEVITYFGSSSEMAAMATALFSQNPNILSGSGKLISCPLLASTTVAATHGTETTADLFLNLPNFKLVSDGQFKIAIDGAGAVAIADLDFRFVSTMEDVAAVIDAELTGASCTAVGNTLVFESASTGAASAILLSAPSAGTDITGANYLSITTAVIVAGAAATTGAETPLQAIVRTQDTLNYVGILLQGSAITDNQKIDASTYVQSLNKILFLASNDATDMDSPNIFYTLHSSNNYRTRKVLYLCDTSLELAAMIVAYAGRAMSTNFSGSNTTQTMHMKDLLTIAADESITQTILEVAKLMGVDTYGSYQGLGKVYSAGENKYFDQVYNLSWIMAELQIAGFNAISTSSTKIVQTEQGVDILKGFYRRICEQAVTNGYVAPGTWNSPERFGNVDDFMRNISERGYYIYSQPISQQSQVDREARKAPLIQLAFKEAGSVHSSNIIVAIEA
jgi:hypothetical protein